MFYSESREFKFKGKPATMTVMRNNGHCWGRIVTQDGAEFDVTTRKDWYEECDDDALEAFIRAARRNVEPAIGWLSSE